MSGHSMIEAFPTSGITSCFSQPVYQGHEVFPLGRASISTNDNPSFPHQCGSHKSLAGTLKKGLAACVQFTTLVKFDPFKYLLK